SLERLGQVLRKRNKLAEAEATFREALTMLKAMYGNDHAAVAKCLSYLVEVFKKGGRLVETEATLREILAIQKKVLGVQSPEVANARGKLLWALEQQHKYAEAEPLMLEANEALQQNRQADPKDRRETIERLCSFYESW